MGYFQPQEGKPELWELDSDQNYNAWKAKMDDYQRYSAFNQIVKMYNMPFRKQDQKSLFYVFIPCLTYLGEKDLHLRTFTGPSDSKYLMHSDAYP